MSQELSRRERQIMDIVYALQECTAQDVHQHMEDQPSYSSVRTHLRILVEKGHLSYFQDGPRYVYKPTVPKEAASKNALQHLLNTFFGGSTTSAVAALLDMENGDLSSNELDELDSMIKQAKKDGR